jgi:hypothetical protein
MGVPEAIDALFAMRENPHVPEVQEMVNSQEDHQPVNLRNGQELKIPLGYASKFQRELSFQKLTMEKK